MNRPVPVQVPVGVEKEPLTTLLGRPAERSTHTFIRFPSLGWPGEDPCRLLFRRPSL